MIFWLVCKGTGHFLPAALAGFTTSAILLYFALIVGENLKFS